MSDQPTTVTSIRPGLTMRGFDRDRTPVADWLCGCGRHERATGADAVKNLAARVLVGVCTHEVAVIKEAA
ncbi:hypothetical protein [Streptomyces sp. NPDC001268]|uniref:hypothetical protein n=1 Tax=Streptomyces sp. NPDC001268 TaxID=3364553 RepID=UPI0036888F83